MVKQEVAGQKIKLKFHLRYRLLHSMLKISHLILIKMSRNYYLITQNTNFKY